MKKVFCFGLGWLGNIVKQYETEYDIRLFGTTASGKQGTVQWNIGSDIPREVIGCEVVVAIPASKWNETDLTKFLKQLVYAGITNILWVSSIGVYPEGTNRVFSEFNNLDEEELSEKEKNLLMQEQLVKTYFSDACILRLGGLFGYERHPAKYFQNNRPIANGQAKANMIHGDDAARLLLTCIVNKIHGVVNGVPPVTPARAMFYTKAFEFLKLGVPNIVDGNTGKHITSELVNKMFPFVWKYKSPIEAYELEN